MRISPKKRDNANTPRRDGVLHGGEMPPKSAPPARSTRKKAPPENVLCPKIPSYCARKCWGRFFIMFCTFVAIKRFQSKKNGRSMCVLACRSLCMACSSCLLLVWMLLDLRARSRAPRGTHGPKSALGGIFGGATRCARR